MKRLYLRLHVCVLIVLFGSNTLLFGQTDNTIYKPFFGQDSTIYYMGTDGHDPGYNLYAVQYGGNTNFDSPLNARRPNFTYTNDPHLYRIGDLHYISYSMDNARQWLYKGGYTGQGVPSQDSILIADMNLALGDSFAVFKHGKKYVIDSVVWKNDIKHIYLNLKVKMAIINGVEFPNDIIEDDYHVIFPYEMIEGVGVVYPDMDYWDEDTSNIDTVYYNNGFTKNHIRAVVKDGELYYQHPLWPDSSWNYTVIVDIPRYQYNYQISVSIQDNLLLIEYGQDLQQSLPIHVYNMRGDIIISDEIMPTESKKSLPLSINAGVYLVQIGKYSTKVHIQ